MIYLAYKFADCTGLNVKGFVEKVYDTNGNGDLLEVEFSQQHKNTVLLKYPSYGNVYVKLKD